MNPNENRDNIRRGPYQLTPDEMRVMKECNRESFFQRCIPMGTGFGLTTYYGVKAGYFRAHAKYGATPKVVVAVILGYFMGKISYQAKCAEKLMQLPNSPIGDMLRKRRKGMLQESMDPSVGAGMSLSPFSGMDLADKYSDVGQSSDLDTTTRPDYHGLDDSQRPSLDNPIYEEEMPPLEKHATSYEELRKQNRNEYQEKRAGAYTRSQTSNTKSPPAQREVEEESKQRRNIYGDPI